MLRLQDAVLGFLPILGGSIQIDGRDIQSFSRSELAKKIAYVPQYHTPPFPYSVFDVVLMGRSAHLQQFSTPEKEDEKIAFEMLKRMYGLDAEIRRVKDSREKIQKSILVHM